MGWPLLLELVRSTKSTLSSVKRLTELSRERFSDKRFGEVFYRMVTKDLEKTESLMNSLLDYMRVTTPIEKAGTVHALIEEALKKYQAHLSEKKIEVTKEFDKDLPEPIVPDEQLRYILSSLLQYVVTVAPPNGYLRFSTRSSVCPAETEEAKIALTPDGRAIEILISLAWTKRQKDEPQAGLESIISKKEERLNLQFRLFEEVVKRNWGTLKCEMDEEKTEVSISLKFPIERRRIVYYQASGG